MTQVDLVRGDKNYYLQFRLEDSEGKAVPLSDPVVVKLRMQKYGKESLSLDKTGEIVDGQEGRCRFRIGEELLNEAGDYMGEIELQFLDQASTVTIPEILVHITKDLPRVVG